jgi:hypothetical protein
MERTVHCILCNLPATMKTTKKSNNLMLRYDNCKLLLFANAADSQMKLSTLQDYGSNYFGSPYEYWFLLHWNSQGHVVWPRLGCALAHMTSYIAFSVRGFLCIRFASVFKFFRCWPNHFPGMLIADMFGAIQVASQRDITVIAPL